jgi:hypothetical protein
MGSKTPITHESSSILLNKVFRISDFPNLQCKDCSGRPAGLRLSDRLASLSRPTDCEVGGWASDLAAVGKLLCTRSATNSAPKPYPDLGSQLRRKSALLLRA